MNDLVIIKKNDVFTDSLIIAKGTNNEHHAIQQLLNKYEEDFKCFGDLLFSHLKCENKTETRGRKQKLYLLNEQQATLLMTYLKNTKVVRKFKIELVKQFYQMRQILLEKQTALWQETRLDSKVNRLAETNEIKRLIEYAKSQGSKNADKYYIVFSKLANKAVGLDSSQRDMATAKQLNNLILIENIIDNVIKDGITKKANYKTIYQDCKNRIIDFVDIAYLTVAV